MNVCLIPAMPNQAPQWQERIYVLPGSLHVTQQPALLTTVLGSSVAVCLWSPEAAAMSHFVLPVYGRTALSLLLGKVLDLGVNKSDILAAVFGGASSLGERNVAEARAFLAQHRLPVIREDVGGEDARKLTFSTLDGATVVRRLK